MNPEIKKKFLDGLRSGEFTQCQNRLVRHNIGSKTAYCILGVLGALYNKEHEKEPINLDKLSHLPKKVAIWAGLNEAKVILKCRTNKEISPFVEEVDVFIDSPNNCDKKTLAELNDAGWSFEDLANIIEEEL